VVFEKGGVYLHTSAKKHQDPDSLIAGVIRVVEKDSDVVLQWVPVEDAGDSTQILFSKKVGFPPFSFLPLFFSRFGQWKTFEVRGCNLRLTLGACVILVGI